ncbi:hypothetical protein COP1_026303 [Malus domestica]
MSDSWKGKASASGQVSDSVEGKYDDYVPELIDNTQVQQAELKDMAIGDPSLLAPSNENAALPPSGQVSDSVEGKYDDYVPELIDNTQVQQAELKDMAIGDPSLLAPSNESAALPPATAVTEPDSQPSESAGENVEPGKRKIDEKGKGKEVEPSESAAENVEPWKRKIDEKGKGKEVEPSESAAENVEPGKRKIDEKGKGKEVEPSESAAENVEPGKRKIDEKGKGKEVEEKQEDGGGGEEAEEEEEEEVKEEAAVRKPKRKKRKGRKQKKRSVRGLLQITEPTELRPEDY